MHKYKRWIMVLIISCIILFVCGTYFIFIREHKDKNMLKDGDKDTIVHTQIVENLSNVEIATLSTEQIENEKDEPEETQVSQETESFEYIPSVVEDDVFVEIKTYIPDIVIELKYASTDNFTGKKIYEFTEGYLRYGTVKKLMQVQSALKDQGLSLKIWDAFRPASAQFILWEVYPDSTYVANPNKGFSSHTRGNTVDITIVDETGQELIMPTKFDDFSKLADRDYSDCSNEARRNALLLENLMKKNGFNTYFGEWWHYTDKQTYDVDKTFEIHVLN